MDITVEEFKEYLERNKETVFGRGACDCPLSGFLSEKLGRRIPVGFREYIERIRPKPRAVSLPPFACMFVDIVTARLSDLTGAEALEILNKITS